MNLKFGYGEGQVGDRDALLVVTAREDGAGKLTIRIRPHDDAASCDAPEREVENGKAPPEPTAL